MNTLREAAQQALEALDRYDGCLTHFHERIDHSLAIAALRAALAEPCPKPLAECQINDMIEDLNTVDEVHGWSFRQGVYAAEKHHGVRP